MKALLRWPAHGRTRALLVGLAAVALLGAATVGFAIVAVASGTSDVATPPPGENVEIQLADGGFVLRLLQAGADAADVERELRGAGLDVSVAAVPFGRGGPGSWVYPFGGVDPTDRTVLHLPANHTGVVLFTGTDELAPSAFSVGAPLHCTGIETLSPAAAEVEINGLGYDVFWSFAGTSPGQLVFRFPDTAPDGLITGAIVLSDTVMMVRVSPAGDPLADQDAIDEAQDAC